MRPSHKIIYAGSPIGSIKTLSQVLNYSEDRLEKISDEIVDYYTEFEKTVKNKTRLLSEPTPALKTLQKRINSRVFSNIRFPHYLHGGINASPPRDFVSNAQAHVGAESAVALDIRNFYPSITIQHVLETFLYLFKFPRNVSEVLAKLVTLNGSLPQGAPTSSYIANLILFQREYKLASKFESQGFIYTRLIDDITVSCKKKLSNDEQTKIADEVIGMLKSYGFAIHPTKKFFYSKSNPQHLMHITGLWLNRGTPRVSRKTRQVISKEVNDISIKASSHGRYDSQYHKHYESVSGKVALLKRMGHPESVKMRKSLDSIKPIYDSSDKSKIKTLVSEFCKKKHDKTKVGYLRKFYKLQYSLSILKRTDKALAQKLQKNLNLFRPEMTLRNIYE